MEQRVSVITVGVAELDRARRFYEGLGWRPGLVHHEVVFFELGGGAILALFGRADLAADSGLPPERVAPGGIALAHNVRDPAEVDAVLAQAAAAGGTVLKAGHATSWGGYTGYFADPDGHPWEVAWNPGWVMDSSGGVRLGPQAL